MPERIDPVGVVDMGVDAVHLPENGLDVTEEVLLEASGFAYPVASARGGRRVRSGGACRRIGCGRRIETRVTQGYRIGLDDDGEDSLV